MKIFVLLLVFLTGAQAVPSWQGEVAARASLRYLPPNMRFREMHRQGLVARSPVGPATDSGGLRLVGKWGGGPSVKVTGRDTFVFLSRGSEVVAINFADTANPEVLSSMQVNGLVSRSVLVGDRLYVGSTGSDPKYIDVFDVSDPTSPVLLGSVQTLLNDIAVQDTLVYAIGDDSLKVFDFADPDNPRLVGACRDSGYNISVCNGYAYLGDRWGLYVVDVRDPVNPQRVASWGTDIISVTARNTICCVTTGNPNQPDELNFSILDVTNPAQPLRIGYLADAGGYDIYLADSLAFLSGYYTGGHEFRILSIADSSAPQHIGECETPGENFGVWADPAACRAYEADRCQGIAAISISNLGSPAVDTSFLGAGFAEDVWVDGSRAYVGASSFGMTILDVSVPANPLELGHVDSTRNMTTRTVVARDSFAYMGWMIHPLVRAIDVSDPADPVKSGGAFVTNSPEDMVLADSFLYVAEAYWFQVVNVARPREPELVGSCELSGYSGDLDVVDTLAFLSHNPLLVVNVADPGNPAIVGTWSGRTHGLDAKDSIVYGAGPYTGLVALSVADPTSPYVLDSLYMEKWWNDVAVSGSLAYVGGTWVRTVDISDPRDLRIRGTWSPPYLVQRIEYVPPYVYAACLDAGVCVLETTAVGIAEGRSRRSMPLEVVSARPTLTRDWVYLLGSKGSANETVVVRDVSGRVVLRKAIGGTAGAEGFLDLSELQAGLYFLEGSSGSRQWTAKIVKQ